MPAKLTYGFLCDGAMQVMGKWTYQGVFTNIQAMKYPAIHPVAILVIRFNAAVGPHILRIKYVNSEGAIIAPEARSPIECREFSDAEATATLQPLKIPAPGFYAFKLFLDEDEKSFGEVEFQALVITPGGKTSKKE